MPHVIVEPLTSPGGPSQQRVEIVERKGVGHPDSICDAVAETIAVALAQEYLRRCGRILHYNIDKGLLIAGQVEHAFGGGRQTRPMRLIFGDRATAEFRGQYIPVDEITRACARRWIGDHLRHVDADAHIVYESVLAPGSPELSAILLEDTDVLQANDTSACVGYYPLTETESLVLATEKYLNAPAFKREVPDTGEDVKIMGFRTDRSVQLTVAMPLLETRVANEDDYFDRKARIENRLLEFAESHRGTLEEVRVSFNALDKRGKGLSGVYVSLLGTSAEDADSGEVGRGNRVNGLISLNRPASGEAAAGKNAVSHVGKIYNVLAHRLAERIYREVAGVAEVWVWLCSRIGAPINRPALASVQFLPRADADHAAVERLAAEIVAAELDALPLFCRDLAAGRYSVL